jgi:hypothetical protein
LTQEAWRQELMVIERDEKIEEFKVEIEGLNRKNKKNKKVIKN